MINIVFPLISAQEVISFFLAFPVSCTGSLQISKHRLFERKMLEGE